MLLAHGLKLAAPTSDRPSEHLKVMRDHGEVFHAGVDSLGLSAA
jgi:hypothetical protein